VLRTATTQKSLKKFEDKHPSATASADHSEFPLEEEFKEF
jgi:hypothetical protein